MDWWLIPIAIGVVALLWFLWVAAFHPAETVSSMRELDGYVPGTRDPDEPSGHAAETDTPTGEWRSARLSTRTHTTPGSEADDPSNDPTVVAGAEPGVADDDGGIWIELDITPLFPSSGHQSVVDLTEVEDPEPSG